MLSLAAERVSESRLAGHVVQTPDFTGVSLTLEYLYVPCINNNYLCNYPCETFYNCV